MDNYYKTLAGLLKTQYAKQLRDVTHVFMPYNGLWIHAIYTLRTYQDFWTSAKNYPLYVELKERVYVVSKSNNGYKPLARGRVTLEAALRTADRIMERGYDEWHRPYPQKKSPS